MYAFLPVDWQEYFYVMHNVLSQFGFIKATIDFSLDREDLHDQVNEYIHTLVEKEKAK